MARYAVRYSEHSVKVVTVIAESIEEAEKIVFEGDANFDDSVLLDTEIVSVNSVREL
jgi:hypothetical protein